MCGRGVCQFDKGATDFFDLIALNAVEKRQGDRARGDLLCHRKSPRRCPTLCRSAADELARSIGRRQSRAIASRARASPDEAALNRIPNRINIDEPTDSAALAHSKEEDSTPACLPNIRLYCRAIASRRRQNGLDASELLDSRECN